MIGRTQTGSAADRVRRRVPGVADAARRPGSGGSVDFAGSGNSLLLMQFRQFCAKLLEGRDRLEQVGVLSANGNGPQPAADPAAPSPVDVAVAAAQNAIAAAQADAAARIAAALGRQPAAAAPGVTPLPATPAPPPIGPDPIAAERDGVRAVLLSLLEQQTTQAVSLGGTFALGTLREAQYVMAALADELILTARWKGKQGWRLLEEELFRSHASGELFFVRLDTLLGLGEAGSVELAMVFFQALSLDFRGRYRNNDPAQQLPRYRRQLFTRIFNSPPELATSRLMPAPEPMQDDAALQWLPHPLRWWGAVAGVLLLWLLVSAVVWGSMTRGISAQLDHIDASIRRTGYRVQP